jgi:hypothetical protein
MGRLLERFGLWIQATWLGAKLGWNRFIIRLTFKDK